MLNYTDEEFLKQISRAVSANKLVIFAGAGVSKLCGLPLWHDLAIKLLDFCVDNSSTFGFNFSFKDKQILLSNVKDSRELVTIASNIICKKSRDIFYSELQKLLQVNKCLLNEKEKQNYDLIPRLIKTLANTVITTNADTIIDEQYDGKLSVLYTEDDIKKFNVSGDDKQIFHIHGSIEKPEDMVFSLTQYLKRYNHTNFRSKMRNIFNNDDRDFTILIIGYSMAELQLLDLIVESDDSLKRIRRNKTFLLKGYYSFEENVFEAESEYYKEYGITLLSYSMDEKAYQGLADALRDIKEYVDAKSKQSINQIQTVIDLFKKKPTKQTVNSFLNIFSEFDNLKREYSFSELQKTPFSYQWVDKILDNEVCFNNYFSIENNMPDCLEDRLAFPGCRLILKTNFLKPKSKERIKNYIRELIKNFLKNRAYFSNKNLADDLCRRIVTDSDYIAMPEAYDFIVEFDKQEYRSDWILFLCHRNNTLLEIEGSILFKYSSLVLSSFYYNEDKEYYFNSFLDAFGARICSVIPNEIVSFCEGMIDKVIEEKDNPFSPRDVFEEIARKDSYFDPIYYIYKMMLWCAERLSDADISSFYYRCKNKRKLFYEQLSIYIASIRYSALEKDLFNDLPFYASNKNCYAEIYSCFNRNSNYISDDKIPTLLEFIEKIKFDKYSEIWNLTARRYLLNALSNNPKVTNNPKYNLLTLETEKTIDSEYKEYMSTMPSPFDMSKSVWSSSAYWTKDEKLSCELKALNDFDLFERIKSANYSDYEVLSSIRDTLELRVNEGFINFLECNNLFKDIPFETARILIGILSKGTNDIGTKIHCVFKIVNSSENNDLKRKLKEESFSAIYFLIHGLDKNTIDPDLRDSVFNYAFDSVYLSDDDWLIDSESHSANLNTIFNVRVFEWLNVLVMTCSEKNWDRLLASYNTWILDETKRKILKASFCGNLFTLWKIDSDFVKNNITILFDNTDCGVNYSNISFQLSMFYSPEFITLLYDKNILINLVSDENFGLNWNYAYLIIWQYLNQKIDIKVLKEILGCRCSASAISSLIIDIEKHGIEHISLDALSSFLKTIANTKFDDSDHCAVGLYKLSEKFVDINYYVEALISLFSEENSATYADDLLVCLNASKLSDYDNELILKTYLKHLKDHYLFVDDIQKLIDAIKWSSEDSKIEIVNQLGEINPAFKAHYKDR